MSEVVHQFLQDIREAGDESCTPEKCMMQRRSLPISKQRRRVYQTGARQEMATVQLSPCVVADLEGILEFITKRDPVLAAITNVREAVQIIQILARHRWSTLATAG